jgi:hypothetical protein
MYHKQIHIFLPRKIKKIRNMGNSIRAKREKMKKNVITLLLLEGKWNSSL